MNPKQARNAMGSTVIALQALIYRFRSQESERQNIELIERRNEPREKKKTTHSNQMVNNTRIEMRISEHDSTSTKLNKHTHINRLQYTAIQIIIISQAVGPFYLEYSKYQAIKGNYCFDNIQCSCMLFWFLSVLPIFLHLFLIHGWMDACNFILIHNIKTRKFLKMPCNVI